MAHCGSARRDGFTVIELLVTLTVLAVALSIAGSGLISLQRTMRAESFLHNLVQDINTSRARTMSTGTPHRLTFVDAHTYRVDRRTGTTWSPLNTTRNPNVTLSGAGSDTYLQFDTKGFARSYNSADTLLSAPINQLTATYHNKTRTVRVTLIGLARIIP